MITFRIATEVKDDRRVVLTLPAEVPTGHAELVVSVDTSVSEQAHTGLADWLEVQVGRNGAEHDRYPLRGAVVRYDKPTEPVANDDWETLK